jgi:hypothetical protein
MESVLCANFIDITTFIVLERKKEEEESLYDSSSKYAAKLNHTQPRQIRYQAHNIELKPKLIHRSNHSNRKPLIFISK